ncbi:hypothetical protein [Cucumibacter marinus]|uniref:hypothetical protein n=1 Tax=Cucumibacter marinus TaxID=1121252 RepID=UPI00041DBC97|nr:hypothetical protein [Cucumibacter marinus]
MDANRAPLARAVEVAIHAGLLPEEASRWRKVVVLEALGPAMGRSKTALRNLFYRDPDRFAAEIEAFVLGSQHQLVAAMQSHLPGLDQSEVVWRRSLEDIRQARARFDAALSVAEAADQAVRQSADGPSEEFRRICGTLAVELMARTLTFFDGERRFSLLKQTEQIYMNSMAQITLAHEHTPEDGVLFARFWENRATRCGLEWHRVWDDPDSGPPLDSGVVELALKELDEAATWQRRAGQQRDDARLRQFESDRARWLIKVGRFDEALDITQRLQTEGHQGADIDTLFMRALKAVLRRELDEAMRLAGDLVAQTQGQGDEDSRPTAALMLAQHVDLLRGQRPHLPETVERALRENPIVVSEFVDFDSFKRRLKSAGYNAADD